MKELHKQAVMIYSKAEPRTIEGKVEEVTHLAVSGFCIDTMYTKIEISFNDSENPLSGLNPILLPSFLPVDERRTIILKCDPMDTYLPDEKRNRTYRLSSVRVPVLGEVRDINIFYKPIYEIE